MGSWIVWQVTRIPTMLQHGQHSVTLQSAHCYNMVSTLLQYGQDTVTTLLAHCYNTVSTLLQYGQDTVTIWSPHCYNMVTTILLSRNINYYAYMPNGDEHIPRKHTTNNLVTKVTNSMTSVPPPPVFASESTITTRLPHESQLEGDLN